MFFISHNATLRTRGLLFGAQSIYHNLSTSFPWSICAYLYSSMLSNYTFIKLSFDTFHLFEMYFYSFQYTGLYVLKLKHTNSVCTVFFFACWKKTRNNNLRKELCKFQMSESLTDRYTYTNNTTRSPGTSHITTSTSTWMFGETTISRIYTVILMFFILFWTVQKDRIFRHFVQNQFL